MAYSIDKNLKQKLHLFVLKRVYSKMPKPTQAIINDTIGGAPKENSFGKAE